MQNLKIINNTILNHIRKSIIKNPNLILEKDFLELYEESSKKIFHTKIYGNSIGCFYSIKKQLKLKTIDLHLNTISIPLSILTNLCKYCFFKTNNTSPKTCPFLVRSKFLPEFLEQLGQLYIKENK